MKVLLDSHVVIWWLLTPEKLTKQTLSLIKNGQNEIGISVASIWEIGLKISRRKLNLSENLVEVLLNENFRPIDVKIQHAQRSIELPPHHSDPFDRILIAQALEEDLTFVTRDEKIFLYDLPLLKA